MIARTLVATTLALAASVSAQTFTDCNPLEKDCPAAPALGNKQISCDFTQGACAGLDPLAGTTLTYGANGAVFSIQNGKQAPTIASSRYIFFGRLEVVARAAPGRGIVSSIVLQSADLDEIDWEWLGYDEVNVQTNYFGKGDTTVYDRGAFHKVASPFTAFHTYTIEWTATKLDWIIDGQVVRTLNYADAKGGSRYPQTPMQVKIGTWVAGLPGNAQGTIDWAGGLADFSKGPFDAYYKSVKVIDYAGGSAPVTEAIREYQFGDRSGSWESIKVVKGEPAPLSSSTVTTPGMPKPTHSNKPGPPQGGGPYHNSSGIAHPTATGPSTSTVYGSTVYVTECPATVTDCPSKSSTSMHATQSAPLSTTLVTSGNSPVKPSSASSPSSSTGLPSSLITATMPAPTVSRPPINGTMTTRPVPVPTAGAAHLAGSLSFAVAAAAVALLA